MFDYLLADLMRVPDKILCEIHEEGDACDVIVRMENGAVYTALFIKRPRHPPCAQCELPVWVFHILGYNFPQLAVVK